MIDNSEWKCSFCGATNDAGLKYCEDCGRWRSEKKPENEIGPGKERLIAYTRLGVMAIMAAILIELLVPIQVYLW